MRVIAGEAKGRALKAVPGMNTRPTTDKVKEAIFSMIGPYFDGGWALDLFAGTGGLGIEALSRGMDKAVFVDMDRASVAVVRANVAAAGMAARAEIYTNEAGRAVKALQKRGQRFSAVFLDPPYRLTHMDELIAELQERELLADDAVIVVEHDASRAYPERIGAWERSKRAEYGETAVTVYRRREDGNTEAADGQEG
ncbi:16S rRNA (guanine(966)-N(2))-methyltransferase RsmD [Paenibacillus sp. FSL W8-1187]|uniref:Ribosomal RNA small subunit methyltransferase D n=1 Tax=Paenibacillus pasadenensis TaxID=217090 RepID=A0A2N5N7E7_9BACL|nr:MULTISPECIES: 16S rRNA (guanine(966)-N(2))-methyltransferase RsmD [Paenibacillus]PLT46243.1 Ribosomal RNA small subunit methyltransferase D [Paenibacillus pasadenensis]QGG56700.1 16S rRNA (guanine(966)-N(2))-methyltransferase RsmD [Paenibacillus sp. B01]